MKPISPTSTQKHERSQTTRNSLQKKKKRIESLYRQPPTDGRVICLDEFGPLSIQPYPGKGWYKEKRANRLPATYSRKHGVRHLIAALDLKTNKLYGYNKRRKRHQELLAFLKMLRDRYSEDECLYIILDHFSPHRHQKVKDWAKRNNVELVYTPTNASWLNRIECPFAPLRKFVLEGSNYASHRELAKAIRDYIRWRNKHKSHKDILNEQSKIKVA